MSEELSVSVNSGGFPRIVNKAVFKEAQEASVVNEGRHSQISYIPTQQDKHNTFESECNLQQHKTVTLEQMVTSSDDVIDFSNQRLVAEMQKRIQDQRQILTHRNQLLDALQKNFSILQTLCHNQKEENRFYKKNNDKLKNENQFMQSKLQELEKLKSFMEAETLRFKEAEQKFKKIAEENSFMKMQMESLNRQLDRKIKELNEADFQMKLMKAENQQLKKEIGEIDDKYRDNLKEYSVMEDKITNQLMQIMKLQALADEQKEHLFENENEMFLMNNKINSLDEELRNTNELYDQKQYELDAKERELKIAYDKIQELEYNNLQLTKQVEQQLKQEKDLGERYRKLQDDFSAKMAEWKRKEEILGEEILVLKMSNGKLIADLEEFKEKQDIYMAQNADTVQELKEEMDHLKNQLNDVNEENYALNKELTETKIFNQREVQDLRQQLDTVRTDLEFELNDKKAELEEVKDRVNTLFVQIRQSENQIEAYKLQAETKQKEAAESNDLMQKYRKDKNDIEIELIDLKSISKDLQEQVDKFKKEQKSIEDREKAKVQFLLDQKDEELLRVKGMIGAKDLKIEELNDDIGQRDSTLAEKSAHIFKIEQELAETKLNLSYVERDFKRQEDGMGSKLKEMDKLYKENETLREELSNFQKNYDFEDIEQKLSHYKEKDEAIDRLFEIVQEIWNSMDNAFSCSICSDVMNNSVITIACGHSFCFDCVDQRQEYKDRCPQCHVKISGTMANFVIDELLKRYKEKKALIVEITKSEIFKKKKEQQ
ncbi:UNKNOWN [Stylonychia lemnae]|uniref:RING-type domain-containing protein n=1 Tax=Stylonychia lemnae TaxID=5949 RepID=A0A078BB13_STYLE|nr:UNKNOWN [Stylonychia lemnae]|eukprot:CDW91589.1 UNKNOWN [Stylonychia lemnae]